MSKSIIFSESRDYLESKDSISFKATIDSSNIICLISSEALQYYFNNGNNEGKGQAFDENREIINKIAELKIQSKAFSAENEIFITQKDCETYGLESKE